MPRPLAEVIAHIRAVSANPAIDITLIQTEDLMALCDAAEAGTEPPRESLRDSLYAAARSDELMPVHLRDLLFRAALALSVP